MTTGSLVPCRSKQRWWSPWLFLKLLLKHLFIGYICFDVVFVVILKPVVIWKNPGKSVGGWYPLHPPQGIKWRLPRFSTSNGRSPIVRRIIVPWCCVRLAFFRLRKWAFSNTWKFFCKNPEVFGDQRDGRDIEAYLMHECMEITASCWLPCHVGEALAQKWEAKDFIAWRMS